MFYINVLYFNIFWYILIYIYIYILEWTRCINAPVCGPSAAKLTRSSLNAKRSEREAFWMWSNLNVKFSECEIQTWSTRSVLSGWSSEREVSKREAIWTRSALSAKRSGHEMFWTRCDLNAKSSKLKAIWTRGCLHAKRSEHDAFWTRSDLNAKCSERTVI